MASATVATLRELYSEWDFTVVVFNLKDPGDQQAVASGSKNDYVSRWAPKSNNDTGAIAINNIAGLQDRFFHVMYRKINFAPLKSWTQPSNGRNILQWVLTRTRVVSGDENCPVNDNCECANAEHFFWEANGCSNCASFVAEINDQAATDQGFIIFQTATSGGGIPRAFSTSNAGRFDFFWNGQYSGGTFPGQFTGNIDVAPFCDHKVDFVA